eukprot:432445-Pyramimonas_sp.AAC.1
MVGAGLNALLPLRLHFGRPPARNPRYAYTKPLTELGPVAARVGPRFRPSSPRASQYKASLRDRARQPRSRPSSGALRRGSVQTGVSQSA